MIGIPRNELVGTSALFPWWEPEERDAMVAIQTAQLVTGRAHHAFQFTRADGTAFPISVDLTRLGEGPGASVMAVVRDLTSEVAEHPAP